ADIVPRLERAGIRFCDYVALDDGDREHVDRVFEESIYPVLTPLAVDPAHPFPYISNLSLNLAVVVADPTSQEPRVARVKLPPLPPHARRRALRPPGAGDRGAPRPALPGHGDRRPPRLPGDPQRRLRRRRRGGRGPHRRRRDHPAPPPPLTAGGASRGRRHHV